jgi:hypothetical protein
MSVFITEKNNIIVKRKELIGTTEYMALEMRYRINQGWPNLLNVRATYDKLQMFESRKT